MKNKLPLFPTWKAWYIFILSMLALQILLFYGITQYFK